MLHAKPHKVRAGPVQLLILQPTPFCNLDCSYCYLPDRDSTARMDWPALELAVDQVLHSRFVDETLTVVWHAGEPLVLPPEWYEEAFARIARRNRGGVKIIHSMQTNGVLINQRWIDLFRRHGVQVGLSLDGPAWLHDACRKTRSGAGSHRRVIAAVELLNDSSFDYHVICVLTAPALAAADEMHDFLRANGIRMIGFNVEEVEGPHITSSMAGPDMVAGYRSFLRRMLELSRRHGAPEIRELGAAHGLILNRDFDPSDNQQAVPLQIVSVGVNGEISTFSPELLGNRNPAYGDFVFGNVATHTLEDVLADEGFRLVQAEIQAGLRACRDSCAYFNVCGGGAPGNKLFEAGRFDVTETMFCRLTRQAPLDVVLAELEAELGLVDTVTAA